MSKICLTSQEKALLTEPDPGMFNNTLDVINLLPDDVLLSIAWICDIDMGREGEEQAQILAHLQELEVTWTTMIARDIASRGLFVAPKLLGENQNGKAWSAYSEPLMAWGKKNKRKMVVDIACKHKLEIVCLEETKHNNPTPRQIQDTMLHKNFSSKWKMLREALGGIIIGVEVLDLIL